MLVFYLCTKLTNPPRAVFVVGQGVCSVREIADMSKEVKKAATGVLLMLLDAYCNVL